MAMAILWLYYELLQHKELQYINMIAIRVISNLNVGCIINLHACMM